MFFKNFQHASKDSNLGPPAHDASMLILLHQERSVLPSTFHSGCTVHYSGNVLYTDGNIYMAFYSLLNDILYLIIKTIMFYWFSKDSNLSSAYILSARAILTPSLNQIGGLSRTRTSLVHIRLTLTFKGDPSKLNRQAHARRQWALISTSQFLLSYLLMLLYITGHPVRINPYKL